MKQMALFIICLSGLYSLSDTGNIDLTGKHAWSEASGWINHRPTHGGVIVYDAFLTGYAWAENIGWIKFGSNGGGPYGNTSASDWGVNRNGNGLEGYAWSENAGWINFNPTHGPVSLNAETGEFDGYAWGENIGWIHFKNLVPSYQVKTVFPTAVLSGTTSICDGSSTNLNIVLTGFGPWEITYSDTGVQSNIPASPTSYEVTPIQTTTYTIAQVQDMYATGSATGEAVITVNPFAVVTNPNPVIPRGWDPEVLSASETCGVAPITYQWTIATGPNAGVLLGMGDNPVTLDGSPNPIPWETTDYEVEVIDSSSRATLIRTVKVLVAVDDVYFDYVVDDCNNLYDLWALCPEWLQPYPNNDDPDGDGWFSVLDYLYINTTDPMDCTVK